MRFLITETCEYVVEAPTREQAEHLFLEQDREVRAPVQFLGTLDLMVEEADL